MAIDTRNKRFSMMRDGVLPLADGTIGAADRMQFLWQYHGFAYTVIPPDVAGLEFTVPDSQFEFTAPPSSAEFTVPDSQFEFTTGS